MNMKTSLSPEMLDHQGWTKKMILDFYQGKRLVVTGSSGYLAHSLLRELGEVDCQIIGLSRKGKMNFSTPGRADVRHVIGNVSERIAWEEVLEGADMVFHFAAQTSAYASHRNPYSDYAVNVLPLLHMGEVCRDRGYRPTVLFSGTVTQSGMPQSLPVNEGHPDNPVTLYDVHKNMAEQYLKFYARQGIFIGISLRLTNVYGPGPEESNGDRGVLNKMIRRALQGSPLILYTAGREIRDYLYIEDAVDAFLWAGICGEKMNGGHFIIGSGQAYSLQEAFELVSQRAALRTGTQVAVEHRPAPEPLLEIERRNFIADASQFSSICGWRPRYSLLEGIDRTLEVCQ